MKTLFQAFQAVLYALGVIYLNYILECCAVVTRWLGEGSPYLTIGLGQLGVSWIVCWTVAAAVFLVMLMRALSITSPTRTTRFSWLCLFLIVVNCIGVSVGLQVLFRAVVPAIGGYYNLWPEDGWDWTVISLALATVVFSGVRMIKAVAYTRQPA